MKTKEEKLALLEDTIKAFNSNTLCITHTGQCCYHLPGKSGCAIGRLIEDKQLCKEFDAIADGSGVQSVEIFPRLPLDLQAYGGQFLENLQGLHDFCENWDSQGLNDRGKRTAGEIRFAIEHGWI